MDLTAAREKLLVSAAGEVTLGEKFDSSWSVKVNNLWCPANAIIVIAFQFGFMTDWYSLRHMMGRSQTPTCQKMFNWIIMKQHQ